MIAALVLAAVVAAAPCGRLELVRAQDITQLREGYPEIEPLQWFSLAYAGDTLCWKRGDTIALGDSLALRVYVARADDASLYRLGPYDVRVPAQLFYSLPRGGGPQVKVLAGFPPGTRPDTLRVVPVRLPPLPRKATP